MIKKIALLMVFSALNLLPGLTFGAGVHTIHIEWSYSGSAVSYNLYQDGNLVCQSFDAVALQMDCDVLVGDQPMVFTLSAVDTTGVESPLSSPYTLIPPAQDVYGNYIPQPVIQADLTSGVAPLPVSFDASASTDLGGSIDTYSWDFGDGETGSGITNLHTFQLAGTYVVSLSVTDNGGASAVATKTIIVSDTATSSSPANEAPVATITATPLLSGTSRIGFDGYSSTDADGSIASYSWNFGDGDVAVGEYIEHEFMALGDYTVVLTVFDNEGASSQDQMVISVVDLPVPNVAPVAVVSASITERLLHFEWDYTAIEPAAGFRFYQNGRLICDIAGADARLADCLTHVDNGLVQIWMTSYDQNGLESAGSELLSFDSTGIFNTAVEGDAPLQVYFTSGSSYDEDGSIVSYSWDFGDGSVAEDSELTHTFVTPGAYTVTLSVTDDAGEISSASTVITVTGIINNPPQAAGAAFATDQNKSLTGTLSATDFENDSLTFSVVTNGSLGVATITNPTTGVFTYVPNHDTTGPDSFSFNVNDGLNASQAATVTVEIVPVNYPPVVQNMSITVVEDGLQSGNLVASDANGDQLTYSLVKNSSSGIVTIDPANGAFTYTPQANISGADSFSFKVNDGNLESNEATVTVAITAVNDLPIAVADSAIVDEDASVSVDVLANDSDADGDLLVLQSVSSPANGSAVVNSGLVVYTPVANFSGSDTLTYVVSDGSETASGTMNITVNPINDLPVARIEAGVSSSTGERLVHVEWSYLDDPTVAGFRLYVDDIAVCETADAAARQLDCLVTVNGANLALALVSFDLQGVESAPLEQSIQIGPMIISNLLTGEIPLTAHFDATSSVDIESAALTYSWDFGDGSSANGAVVEHVYPELGVYPVVVTVTDEQGATTSTSVEIIAEWPVGLNRPPVAESGVLSLVEDEGKTGILAASDPDGDSLVYSLVNSGSGAVSITDTTIGAFTYTPAQDFYGSDSFTFKVNDGTVDSATATVTVTVTAANDAPVAENDTVVTDEDQQVVVNVLANDTDVDGDSLTIDSVGSATNGAVSILGGSVLYVPSIDFNGTDSFSYEITDSQGAIATGQVNVTINAINDPPVIHPQDITTQEDQAVIGTLAASDLDGDTLTYLFVSNASSGTAVISDSVTGAFTYTPAQDFYGSDSFTFKVNDGTVDSATATVTVTVAATNDAPVAENDTAITDEDNLVTMNVLTNDTDIDGDSLTINSVGSAANGAVSISGASVIYVPNNNFNGTDSFTYEVSDGHGGVANATINITVNAVNDTPLASNVSAYMQEDTPFSGLLVASDVDDTTLSYSIVSQGAMGTVTVSDSVVGTFTYIPEKDRNGTDSFSFKVSDGNSYVVATVTLDIAAVNDLPVAQNDNAATESGKKVVVDLLINDSDIDGDSLVLESVSLPLNGAAVITDGRLEYVANPDFIGDDILTYIVSDGNGGQATGEVIINVTAPTQLIAYSWDYDPAAKPAGFKMYRNEKLLCQTSDPAARNITCRAPVVDGVMTFTVTAIAQDGTESALSNPISYGVPQTNPDEKKVTFSWDYDSAVEVGSFRMYMNGNLACETQDSTARQLSCNVIIGQQTAIFSMVAVDLSGGESQISNMLTYTPVP